MKSIILCCSIFISILSAANAQEQSDKSNITKGEGGIVYYPRPISNPTTLDPKDECNQKVQIIVKDTNGNPLVGCSISDLNEKFYLTNAKGRVSIEVEEKPFIMNISHPNYYSLETVISHKYRGQELEVHLKEIKVVTKIELKEVIVNGVDRNRSTLVGKPLIYLYPETTTTISIINHFKGELLTTYPAYNDGWKVIAEPNGKLLNLADNRNYNWLFWDGHYDFPASHYDFKEGFYVDKKDYTDFLHHKLALIGLNENEINDFVVYWLPILNQNEESFIYFSVNDDLGNSSRLEVTPKPDTMIRVLMEYKKHEGERKLPEQKLSTTKRSKFTLVEWGGAEIDSNIVK